MKLKIICTLTVLIGLCITSCRNSEEIEEIVHLGNNKNGLAKTAEENTIKKDSTTVYLDDNDTKNPPKTGQQWRNNN